MKKRKIFIWAFMLSLVGFVAGYVMTNSVRFGLCVDTLQVSDASCMLFFERIANPLYYGCFALGISFILLFIFPRTLTIWKYFGYWFIPLAFIILATYPNPGAGDFLSPDPSTLARWISYFYATVSIVIILSTAIIQKVKKDSKQFS